MHVITGKLYLHEIHKATIQANAGNPETVDIAIQKRVLEDLKDWKPDDCMIDGYDYSVFEPYKDLVKSKEDEIWGKIDECNDCGYTYQKAEMKQMDNGYICEDCIKEGKEQAV